VGATAVRGLLARQSGSPRGRTVLLGALCLVGTAPGAMLRAQARPVTRSEVVATAVARGARLALARADSSAAGAQLSRARQFENPTLTYEHTRDTPRQHLLLDVPLVAPGQRSLQVRAAGASLDAATLRAAFEREAVAIEADTLYTRALVARERARLSAQSALDADSLVALTRVRRDAGDGSELDVQLAALSSGQFANAAALDSLDALGALLDVQAAMGLGVRDVAIILADSLDVGSDEGGDLNGTPLLVAAAQADVRAAESQLSLERARLFVAPSLTLGVEQQDPGGTGNQLLPLVGVSLPLPLFNRNRAGMAIASAERERARAELLRVQVEMATARTLAERERRVAGERLARSGALLASADRVAAMSLLAYREGASALPSVLEAQRSSRETRSQYLEALGAARSAAARLRLLTLTSNPIVR